jgi:hypothetical protein
MWRLNEVTDDEILNECGMDALCVLRLLRMGYRICLVSIFNAIWLMPLYASSPIDATNVFITDPVVRVTIAHVASGSKRLVGTVLAAYILFVYVMYLILKEFEWFIEMRHKHLKKPVAENYTVYVRNVPLEYRSNAALHDYFANCFSDGAVLETKLRIKAPTLSKAVKKRDDLVGKLEHALNYEQVKGKQPMHRENRLQREPVASIPLYARQLNDANRRVTELIEGIERNTMRQSTIGSETEGSAEQNNSNIFNDEAPPEPYADP